MLPALEVPSPPSPDSRFVVFDIDGTLTPHNLLVRQARADAAKAVGAFASKGYAIVYLTTRVPQFQGALPGWLKDRGFPAGHLHVAQNPEEREHAAEYKSRVLNEYISRGWRLAYAFGDSSTDFEAYQRAGLPKGRIFALKRKGSDACEPGEYGTCLEGWTEYLPTLDEDRGPGE
jgi:phosphatidate phosphatase PAH1